MGVGLEFFLASPSEIEAARRAAKKGGYHAFFESIELEPLSLKGVPMEEGGFFDLLVAHGPVELNEDEIFALGDGKVINGIDLFLFRLPDHLVDELPKTTPEQIEAFDAAGKAAGWAAPAVLLGGLIEVTRKAKAKRKDVYMVLVV